MTSETSVAATPPEFRQDELTGEWVIIAPERAIRPLGLGESAARAAGGLVTDVFLPGNERNTMPEVWADRPTETTADTPGWRVRVFPNRYPAVRADVSIDALTPSAYRPAYGEHEVIVECPDESPNLGDCSAEQIGRVLRAFQSRLLTLGTNPHLRSILIFKNHGLAAGASQPHPHSQLVALPFVPPRMQAKLDRADAFAAAHGQSLYASAIEKAEVGRRIVIKTAHFAVLCPFASRFPYEVVVVPKYDEPHFVDAANSHTADLADILKRVLAAWRRVLGDPAYNFVLYSAPLRGDVPAGFRWHWELFPRTSGIGGFEWGSGMVINSHSPETAAADLRAALHFE